MDTDATPPDDAIPYPMAAKALKISRRTVERMVDRGQLQRAPGAHVASVTRLSLNGAMEARGQDPATTPRHGHDAAQIEGAALLAMLDQISEANNKAMEAISEAAELKIQLRQIEAAAEDREQATEAMNELVDRLVHGSRRERREARREARRRTPPT